MTEHEIDQLFNANIAQLNKLNIASGSMIKALLQGLASNGPAYIQLSNATDGGHKVNYAFIQGDTSLVTRLASALGLIATDNSLETHHA
jgi:hypothetical protein